jgi:hypothetical protein
MTIDQVTGILTGIRGRVTSETLDTIRKILVITQEYSFLGERFTFDASKDLSDQVNQLLIQLSDAMLEEADRRTLKTIDNDDDDDTVLAWIHREYNGESNEERMDRHASALRFLLEGYLAVSFANKLSRADIIGDTLRFLANPYGWKPIQDARQHPERWTSETIREVFKPGRGNTVNPIDAMANMIQYEVLDGYNHGLLLEFGRDPDIIGYRVERGSSYDCELSDEIVAGGIYSLDDQRIPAHVRCRCIVIPVRASEL